MVVDKGELFSRIYRERGTPVQDSKRFRMRLYGYLEEAHNPHWSEFVQFFRREAGIDIRGSHSSIQAFFKDAPIDELLDCVTVEYRRLRRKAQEERSLNDYFTRKASSWFKFVERTFQEENLGYVIERDGGVRYFVDEEFERNRVSSLAALNVPQLEAVRDAFESAHRYLDPGSRDMKASVRSAFEAMEILARLMYPSQSKLSKNLILQQLRPDAEAAAPDEVAKGAISAIFKGLADIVDGAHDYRHGQEVHEPVDPPLDYAVFFVSLIASAIRWMVPLWEVKTRASL